MGMMIQRRRLSAWLKTVFLISVGNAMIQRKKTGCITAAGLQKKLESYKKIKLFRCYKCLSLPGHPYLLCGIGKSFCRAGVGFRT